MMVTVLLLTVIGATEKIVANLKVIVIVESTIKTLWLFVAPDITRFAGSGLGFEQTTVL
jgi:hypothetical protein